ncbi:DUF7344 domain-containing protein [Haloarcula marina]|uniref:DUF7344 domain-containing protein n=1 Tax=Haloarcula marina TaxID=2961574 RepID=UPI0020B75CC3|nr:hypothetical protein [Halomicroarcula marina]
MVNHEVIGGRLTDDEVYDLLSHPHRISAIRCLRRQDEAVSFNELAEYIAMEVEPDGDIRNGELIGQIKTQLHHAHLPKLLDAGVVEFSRETDLVRLTAEEELRPFFTEVSRIKVTT